MQNAIHRVRTRIPPTLSCGFFCLEALQCVARSPRGRRHRCFVFKPFGGTRLPPDTFGRPAFGIVWMRLELFGLRLERFGMRVELFGMYLEAFWKVFCTVWNVLGPSWKVLGTFWNVFGIVWNVFGTVLEA